jgi:hypothetical protein
MTAVESAPVKVSKHRARSVGAAVIATLTAILLVVSVIASWTSGTALNTEKFVKRISPIMDEPAVRTAVATEIGNELVTVLHVQDRLTPVLPSNLAFLSAALATGVERVVREQVTKIVDSNAFDRIWVAALTLSHQQVVTTLTGSRAPRQIINGKIYVNLIDVVVLVMQDLVQQLPTIFGTALAQRIPDGLTADAVRLLLSRALGVDLSATFASVPILDATALDQARKGIKVINLAVILVIALALVAFAAAVWLSPRRRRTLVQIGLLTAGLTGVLFFVVRGLTRSAVSGISDDTLRPAAASATRVVLSSLRQEAIALFVVALVLALVAYVVGSSRSATALRGQAARGWTAHNELARTNLDALRIGAAVVAAVVLLLWTSWWALLIVAVLLAAYEIAVTLVARQAGATEPAAAVDEPLVETQ